MITKYNHEDVDAALCILGATEGDNDRYNWLSDGEGYATVRDNCIYLAVLFEGAWKVAHDVGYESCFDFEFVPALLDQCIGKWDRPSYVNAGQLIVWARQMGKDERAEHEQTMALFNNKQRCPSCGNDSLGVTSVGGRNERFNGKCGTCDFACTGMRVQEKTV